MPLNRARLISEGAGGAGLLPSYQLELVARCALVSDAQAQSLRAPGYSLVLLQGVSFGLSIRLTGGQIVKKVSTQQPIGGRWEVAMKEARSPQRGSGARERAIVLVLNQMPLIQGAQETAQGKALLPKMSKSNQCRGFLSSPTQITKILLFYFFKCFDYDY